MYSLLDFLKTNKVKIFVCLLLLLTGLLTGVFTAIKCDGALHNSFDYLLYDFVEGELVGSDAFYSRILSVEIVFVIVSVTSLTQVTSIIGLFVLIYRSYLVGFNVCLIIINFGFTGIMTSIIVIVFQISILSVFLIYLIIRIAYSRVKSKYGKDSCKSILKINPLISTQVILLILIICETLMFIIFQSKVILSI